MLAITSLVFHTKLIWRVTGRRGLMITVWWPIWHGDCPNLLLHEAKLNRRGDATPDRVGRTQAYFFFACSSSLGWCLSYLAVFPSGTTGSSLRWCHPNLAVFSNGTIGSSPRRYLPYLAVLPNRCRTPFSAPRTTHRFHLCHQLMQVTFSHGKPWRRFRS